MSSCTLYHGDCLEVMPKLEHKSFNMVFADLPYGVTHCEWDCPIDLSRFWETLDYIRNEKCAVVLSSTQPFGSLLINSDRANFKYQMIWAKKFAGNFAQARYRPLATHEELLVFAYRHHTYNAQMIDRITPIKSGGNKLSSRSANRMDPNPNYKKKVYTKKHPTTIIEFSCRMDKRGMHPTQKPVALLEWLIKTYTNEGDTVLDPVFGSNTTGVACVRLGRNYVGIEKDPEYFRIGTERVNAERLKLDLEPAVVEL